MMAKAVSVTASLGLARVVATELASLEVEVAAVAAAMGSPERIPSDPLALGGVGVVKVVAPEAVALHSTRDST